MSPESARLAAERIEREGAVRWRDENVLHWRSDRRSLRGLRPII